MIYFLIVLNFIVITFLVVKSVKNFGILNYFLVFSIFSFLYTIAIPIEIIILQKPYVIEGNSFSINQMELILVLSLMSVVGFYIGLLLIGNQKFYVSESKSINIKIQSPVFLGLSTMFILLVFYRTEFFTSMKSYADNYTLTYNSSVYAYIKETLFGVFSALALIYLLKNNARIIFSILLCGILIFIGFATKDKNPILMALIPWIWFGMSKIHFLLKRHQYFIILVFILGVTVIPIFNSFFGSYRGNWDKNVVKYYTSDGLFGAFESKAILGSLLDVTNSEERLYGETYLAGFVNWIPKSIWKHRPESLAESYAKYKIKNWAPGVGRGFSLLSESYLNFGIFGAFIQYFFIGLFIGLLRYITHKLFLGNNFLFAEVLFFIWAFNELVLMHRGQFNIPSSYIRFILPFYILYLLFDKYKLQNIVLKWKERQSK